MTLFPPQLKSYLVTLRKPKDRKDYSAQLLACTAERAIKIARSVHHSPKAEVVSVKKLPTTSRLRRLNRERDLAEIGLLHMAMAAGIFGKAKSQKRGARSKS